MASRSAAAPRLRLPARRASRSRSRARPLHVTWLRRALALLVIAAVLAAGYFLWLRDSSLVAVENVRVEGLTELTDPAAAEALEVAARDMTTLHVELDELGRAVADYPTIKSLSASPSFPSGLEITVVERPPVAVAGDSEVPVATDGTLLPEVDTGKQELPAIDVAVGEGGGTLDGAAREQTMVLGAAPEPLRPVIERSTTTDAGVEVALTNGIALRFGDAGRAGAKWEAAARILAEPSLTSVTYIDLRVPERPAVGGAVSTDGATEPLPPG
jgi:cell division protein FtsQ